MADTTPKYPSIEVQLSGEDGNAFMIASRVRTAIQRKLVSDDPELAKSEGSAFFKEALSGDYDNVIRTAMKWVTVL